MIQILPDTDFPLVRSRIELKSRVWDEKYNVSRLTGVIKCCNVEEECRSERESYEWNDDSLTLEYCKAQRRAMLVS